MTWYIDLTAQISEKLCSEYGNQYHSFSVLYNCKIFFKSIQVQVHVILILKSVYLVKINSDYKYKYFDKKYLQILSNNLKFFVKYFFYLINDLNLFSCFILILCSILHRIIWQNFEILISFLCQNTYLFEFSVDYDSQ